MKYKYYSGSEFFIQENIFLNCVDVIGETDYHAHNFIEIAYILKGSGRHIIGDDELNVKEGDITIINYDIPHKFISGERTLTVYNCLFKPLFLDFSLNASRSFKDITNHFLMKAFLQDDFSSFFNVRTIGKENLSILAIYNKMLDEFDGKKIGYSEILRGYLIELLVTILRFKKQGEIPNTANISGAIEYICDNFNKKITTKELSSLAFLSPTHFCRQFKKHTGMNVKQFIQKIRIEEACKQLVTTDKKIIEIANEVGYQDIKFFIQLFKILTGKSPSNFKG